MIRAFADRFLRWIELDTDCGCNVQCAEFCEVDQ